MRLVEPPDELVHVGPDLDPRGGAFRAGSGNRADRGAEMVVREDEDVA